MDPEQIARYKQEYYEAFAGDESLHDLLNQHGGLVLARSGSHPPWPARISEAGEFAKMSRHRQKKGQLCVYFFGTRNYGWVYRSAIMPFSDDYTALKASKKYSPHMIQRAIDALQEARVILDDTDSHQRRFYDRVMERIAEPVDMPCEICNRVDDHFSMLILCDGKDCKREFHMNCLSPPLEYVPPGDWYCPDCAKDPSKQQTWESSQEDSYATEEHAPDSAKKMKKEKLKVKEGSMKRKLPATHREKSKSEADVSPANVKKQKAQRVKADASSPSNANSRPSTPVQSTKKAMELSMLMNAADDDHDQQNRQSEERCLICNYGGELVVCEFYGCTKVYHQFCLGSYPFPKDEDATWYCPRHVCAISGTSELVEENDGLFAKPSRKFFVKDQLWKCVNCPLAIADEALPPIPKSYVLSRSNRSFTCMHCSSAAPVKVALAKKIERIWSMVANNTQGMAFCGPLLPGVELPKGRREGSRLFLFRVLAKIRRLEYDDSASFARDIDHVVREALDIINNRSIPLVEAATTLRTICNEQMKIHRTKLDALDSKISGLQALSKSKKTLEEAYVSATNGEKRRWPLRWREECGPFDDQFYPRVDPRSLSEWTAFITSAGVFASCDEYDQSGGRDDAENPSTPYNRGGHASNGGRAHRRLDESSEWDSGEEVDEEREAITPSFPGLTLSEGTDVIMALAELSGSAGGSSKRFGAWPEEELDEINAQDFFLSPSVSEMQQMFDQQSAVLRRALESHTALQKAWLVNKQKLLGLGEGSGFSVGEGRLAAELRLANKNLRARLRNKDKLVDQLSSEQAKLRSEVLALQNQLQEVKGRVSSVERGSKTDEDFTGSDGGEDSADSADTDRKSPRNPGKSKAAAKAKLSKAQQKAPRKTSGASGRPS